MLSKVVHVENYRIVETSTIRSQDLRRFMVTKHDGRKASASDYVVTFQQNHRTGCSCPAGRTQKACKHVHMVQSVCP